MAYCELCKQRAATQGMGAVLKDVNGNTSIVLCQQCMKKLKNAVKSPEKQVVEIYPVKKVK